MSEQPKKVKVFHIIDGLGGGGSERWIFDIVRKSDLNQFSFTVGTVYPFSKTYEYAKPLANLGVYHSFIDLTITSNKNDAVFKEDKKQNSVLDKFRSKFKLLIRPFAIFLYKQNFFNYGNILIPGFLRNLNLCLKVKPDVIHAHTFHGFVLGYYLSLILRKPLLYTYPCLISQMEDAKYSWFPGIIKKKNRRVKYFFCAKEYTSELEELGVKASKIIPINAAVDIESVIAIQKNSVNLKAKIINNLDIDIDAICAISVGRLHPSKGHRIMMDAVPRILKKCPNFHWIVLGEGTDREYLEQKINMHNLNERVFLLGFQSDSFPFYAISDIYCRTTLFEGDNLSSAVALAFGIPFVSFKNQNVPDSIQELNNGFYVKKNAESLADGIIEIIKNLDGWKKRGKVGTDYAKKYLNLNSELDKFYKQYLT